MNVLMVSTSYPQNTEDWRGVFIRNMANALAARDDISLALWAPPGEVDARIRRACSATDDAWLSALIDRGGIAQVLRERLFSGVAAATGLLRRLHRAFKRETADIYHINWLQNALALPHDGRPALLTVLGTDMRLLSWPGMRWLMRRACSGRRVIICPNAEWMAPILAKAFQGVASVRTVAFGIDPQWYEITRRFEKENTAHWLVVARVTSDKIGDLVKWGAEAFASNHRRTLHLIGPRIENLDLPPWIEQHGPATPRELCEKWFPMAQGLITLSRHAEGRPQVMLEAMAAGLPIIASRLPAHENLISHASTGWIADSQNDFAAGLAHLESSANNRAMGTAAQARVRADFGTWDDCAKRYKDLYLQMLAADG